MKPSKDVFPGPGEIEISVVVPAYNEESCLGDNLRRIISHLHGLFSSPSWEIIVVDDGSTDQTGDIARAMFPEGVTVLHNLVNRGKGFSVRKGVLASRGRFVLFTDADLSTPIQEMEGLLDSLRAGAGVAIASRSLPRSVILKNQAPVRSLLSRVFLRLVQALAVQGVSDSQCGFKAFTRDAALALFRSARIDGYAFDVELLRLAEKWGMNVVEVPVTWTDSGRSTISILSLKTLRMLWDLILIRYRSA